MMGLKFLKLLNLSLNSSTLILRSVLVLRHCKIFLIFALLFLFPVKINASINIIDHYLNTNSQDRLGNLNDYVSERMKPNSNISVSHLGFLLKKTGSPNFNLKAMIGNCHLQYIPTPIATSSAVLNTTNIRIFTYPELYLFKFDNNVELNSSTYYCFGIYTETLGDSSNYIDVSSNHSNFYRFSGDTPNAIVYKPIGGVYTYNQNWDASFILINDIDTGGVNYTDFDFATSSAVSLSDDVKLLFYAFLIILFSVAFIIGFVTIKK